MGRSLIIAVAAAAIFGTISLIGGAGTSADRSAKQVGEHGERLLAREIAISGHGSAVAAVSEVVIANGTYDGPGHYEGNYQGGTYVSTVEVAGEVLTVITRGHRTSTSYVIRATYLIDSEGAIPDDVPEFMSYALLVEQDLNITGNAGIHGSGGSNANVHTNGAIKAGGHPLVQGFGTHVNGATPANRISSIFQPNDNPDNLPSVQTAEPVEIPEFNAEDYQSRATIVTEGNLSLGSSIPPFGTRTNPTIWYVSGDLTISGGDFVGYVIFVVDGDINIAGNMTTSGGVGNESTVAFYTESDVRIAGGSVVRGQIFASGDAIFEGNASLHGSMTVGGQASFSGTFDLFYREPSPALTGPIWEDDGADGEITLTLTNYREGG